MQNYDFNIDNYTHEELLDFFKIPEDSIDELTITSRINNLMEKYNSSSNKDFFIFLNNSKTKLLSFVTKHKPPQQKPTNYDIIHSESNTNGGIHEITENKVIPVVNTYNYKYPDGVINPIEKRIITKIINFDTLFRNNYYQTYASDYVWELPTQLNKVVSMSIASLEIPNVWYTISNKNCSDWFNIKLFNVKKPDGTFYDISHKIVIPEGNYLSATFVNLLNIHFQNIKQGLDLLVVTINTTNTKTTIRARNEFVDSPTSPAPYNSADIVNYSPDFYFMLEFIDLEGTRHEDAKQFHNSINLQKSLGWFMGFRHPIYVVREENELIDNVNYINGPITFLGIVESESSYGSSLYNYIFIEVTDYNKNVITDSTISLTNNAYIGNNILGRITVGSLPNNIIFNNDSDCVFKKREYMGPVKISKIRVRILNKFGEPIDLNHNDFSIALEFKLIY